MNSDELNILLQPEIRRLIWENREEVPEKLALQWQKSNLPSALMSQQIKYLQKAEKKLPEWYAAQCLFTRTTFEQCSSSATVQLKWLGQPKGIKALDLTCGQGVDTWGLAAFFEHIIAVDLDPVKVEMATYNLGQLGVNASLVNADSAVFLAAQPSQSFDLAYIDPARRDQADRRKVTFSDCEPDVLPMLPDLLRVARQVWIKASPMIRVEEALAQLGQPACVRVLAVQGECREVLFGLGLSILPSREARWMRDGQLYQFVAPNDGKRPPLPVNTPAFLLEADVSLYKAEIAGEWMHTFPEVAMNHPMGYGFAEALPPQFPGRAFEVLEACEYKPKLLKQSIKQRGWKKVHLSSRHFDLSIAQVRQGLGLPEGEDGWILLTRLPDGKRMAYLSQRA